MEINERIIEHFKDREENKTVTEMRINPHSLQYEIDNIQNERVRDRMMKNPEYARIMSMNKTKLFFEWLQQKIKLKENITIEIKGYTRSGKSVTGITISKLITKLVKQIHGIDREFEHYQVCKNESDFNQKVRNWAKQKKTFNTAWVVDEQTETHVGMGSYSELTMQEDINNIVAMECLHVCWIHPPHFVGRNALVGLETYGRNFEYGITRCIMYDLHENKKVGIPMGLVYIPIFRDREFEKQYIGKKLEQIEGVMTGQDITGRVDARFKIARALAKNNLFVNATNNTIRLALARKYCPFGLPDSAVKEIMVLARLPSEELEAMLNMETDADVIDVSLEDLGWGGEGKVEFESTD